MATETQAVWVVEHVHDGVPCRHVERRIISRGAVESFVPPVSSGYRLVSLEFEDREVGPWVPRQ